VKKAFFLILFIFISSSHGSEMVHGFKSPVFNGANFSGHALTVENLARTRKQAVKDNLKADLEQQKIQATVTWQKNGDLVTLYINDPATGSSTQIQLPVGVLKPGGG
jgi:hypothetical protein